MKKFYNLCLICTVVFCSSCISIQFKNPSKTSEKMPSSEVYLDSLSKATEIDKKHFYYVSTESDSTFLKNIQASIVSFVKGNQSTSIDKIMVENENGATVPLNTCGADRFITKEEVEDFLKKEKTYEGLVLKSIKTRENYTFPEDEIVSFVLYSKKVGAFMQPELNRVKDLKEKYNINFIIVSMDLEELHNIPDIWDNAIF
ncbi:hypothetical protein [Mesonia sp.]|uniref:hypothetical protein n=1 Tax=Mesonia sp. TaxID=1960830 RepID=UPI003F956496